MYQLVYEVVQHCRAIMNLLYGTNVSMADTASGAQDAADATGEMADNLEDANKAAKGSLAALIS